MLVDLLKSLPAILPLSEAEKKIDWSVMIPCHNNATYLEKTLESVLIQYPGPDIMQIMVVDDNSSVGDPEKIVNEVGQGRVTFFRQPENVGHSRNYDTCIRKSKGKLVHILHEDDKVRPGFYDQMSKLFLDFPGIGAAFCRQIFIDEKDNWISISELEKEENGILDNWLLKIAEKQRIQYCSMVVKRSTYENLGGFINKEIAEDGWQMAGEDWEMWVRIAAHYDIGYLTQPLAEYRIHKSSMTSNLSRTGKNIRDLQKIINLLSKYVPENKKELIKISGEKHFAEYAFNVAKSLMDEGYDKDAASAQLNEAIKMDPEIIENNLNVYLELNKLIEHSGVSVIICRDIDSFEAKNFSDFINYKIPGDNFPLEIIYVDISSENNHYNIVEKELSKIKLNNFSFKILTQPFSNIHEARYRGIEESKYDYILFYDKDISFSEGFISKGFNILNETKEIGLLGGSIDVVSEKSLPEWLDRNQLNLSYGILPLIKESGDISYSKGSISIKGAFLRKKAWKEITENGYIPLLADRILKDYESGNDTELCHALRNAGWKIWYEPDMKLKQFLPAYKTNWKYLRKKWRESGMNSNSRKKPSKALRFEIRKLIRNIRNTGKRRLTEFKKLNEGDSKIIHAEYYLGKLNSLLKSGAQTQKKRIRLLRKAARKSDYSYLRLLYKNFDRKISTKGVSVIICCYNSSKLLPETLHHLSLQKVRSYVRWEVIVVDNASTDNTEEVALKEWSRYKNCKGILRVVKQPIPGLSAAREKGIEESKYEYMVFCDDDNWLEKNYLQTVVSTMRVEKEIGIIGCETEEVCEVNPPDWFDKWKNWSYAVGEQFEKSGDITWSRGFVWGAGMVLRRKALNQLYKEGFRSLLTDRKGKELASGGDTELCFALRLAGWRIWYEPKLKLKHYMTAPRLKWEYLLKLWKGFGISTVGLDTYLNIIPEDLLDGNYVVIKKSWKENLIDTLNKLRQAGYKKVLNRKDLPEGDPDLPLIVHNLARLKELFKLRKQYIERIDNLSKSNWKKNFYQLRLNNNKYKKKEIEDKKIWPWVYDSDDNIENDININENFKISILTPSFNSEFKIEKAIESVLKQNYKNFEHIIVDGGSKDNTLNILKKYPHLIWISEPDKGQSDAMNKAFAMSTGEIICYLNSDDFFLPHAFKKVIKTFQENEKTDMVIGNLILDMKETVMTIYPETDYRKIMQPFTYSFPINPVSYFYKRKVQENTGIFPLDNHYTMDYWFLLKVYQKFNLIKIDELLGTFYFHEVNKTSTADNALNTHNTVMKHLKQNDIQNIPYYLFFYYKNKLFGKKRYSSNKSILRHLNSENISRLSFSQEYSDYIFNKAKEKTYNYNHIKGLILLGFSVIVYPPHFFSKSRRSLLYRSLFGHKIVEISRNIYYNGIVKKYEIKDSVIRKYYSIRTIDNNNNNNNSDFNNENIFKIYFGKNSLYHSNSAFLRSKEECYNYNYLRGILFFLKSISINPFTILSESRRSLLIRLILGHKLTEILRDSYYQSQIKTFTLKSKVKRKYYYKKNSFLKFRDIFKNIYFYFRYRKFKAKSKILYAQAIEYYKNDKRYETIKVLIPSFLLYPISIFNRNKLSLIKNSILGNSGKKSNNTDSKKSKDVTKK